ncbi:hypothetical protein V2J09_007315 [Rumex salicifolius]
MHINNLSMVRNLLGLGKLIRARKQQLGSWRFLHRVSFVGDGDEEEDDNKIKIERKNIEECDWIPHPRNGIYSPKGHDWVMEDVPASAASLAPTYWLRSVDGVDSLHVDHHHHVD